MNWTTAGDLERWADTLDARARLPQLVRKLIFATDDTIVKRDFPAGEGVQRTGWDGMLESAAGSDFVPLGISRWEMGVDKDPRSKAEGDFEKREKEPLGVDQSQTSFVFVTPRKWSKKLDWQQEKQALGIWKDVRVYDSSNLEEWLETAPAVDAWLARTTGRRPHGVVDIGEHWDNLTALTNPPLRPRVFLTSRADNIKQFSEWIARAPSALSIEASSPTEVVDFAAAYIASLEETEQNQREARIVVVESRDAWQVLSASKNRLILIQHPRLVIERELVAQAVRQNHHVLLCAPRLHKRQGASFELTRPFRHELQEALIESGLSEQDAARLSRSSAGSLPILKRRMSVLPSVSHPAWSLPPDASDLVPLVLAGGWDDSSDEDRKALSKLAKRPYEDILHVASRWLASEDSPLMQVGTGWNLVSHEDAWLLLVPKITRIHLDAFVEVAVEVLGADDPALELPASDRLYAALYNKLPKHSGRLRAGLIETLALLGAKSESEEIQDGVGAANRADFVVRTIVPENATWQRWATLSKFLPLLVEASPDVLLDRFEKDLVRADSQLFKLFEQEGEPLLGTSPHTGLLWALENLAWEPAYLTRAALILARLARLDPGGKLGNRPSRSLTGIFLCWLPQTEASSDQRIRVIDKLLKQEPEVAWKLLLSLLPEEGCSTPTHKPSYRNWGMSWSKGVTHTEYAQQIVAVADRLLANSKNAPARLESLIENCNRLPATSLERLLVDLKAIDQSTLDIEARRRLSNKLRDQAHSHRRFASAHWALPSAVVDELEAIQALFEPDDLSDRYGWLFVQWPHLPNEDINWSYQQREAAVFDAQSKVVRELFQQHGVAAVFALAKAVAAPGAVGLVLAKASLLDDESAILPKLLDSDNQALALLARCFAFGRFCQDEWSWLEGKDLSTWSDEKIVSLSMILPFGPKTWSFIEARGDIATNLYWSKTQPFPHDLTTQDIETAASRLIEFGRPLQAADFLCSAMYQKHTFDPVLLFGTLEAGLTSLETKAEMTQNNTMLAHSLQQLFAYLQSLEDIEEERLARLEWNYLFLLDGHPASPKALHTWLARDGKFFAEAIELAYRSRLESDEEQAPPSEELRAKARNVSSLLESWDTVPGALGSTVDEKALRGWVNTARERCEATGHIEVCDSTVGRILARSPAEPDESWPCVAVREVLENIATDEILRGFETGVVIQRGIISKTITEGGQQERDLAALFSKRADICKIDWPRVSAVLRKLAKHYECEAKSQDSERDAQL